MRRLLAKTYILEEIYIHLENKNYTIAVLQTHVYLGHINKFSSYFLLFHTFEWDQNDSTIHKHYSTTRVDTRDMLYVEITQAS